jgi:hypothetical protein
MATIGNTYATLSDILKASDQTGKISSRIINILSKVNPIVQDAVAVECNQGTGHMTTRVASMPSPTLRGYNEGVAATKATTQQKVDTCSIFQAKVEADELLLELQNNKEAYLMMQAKAKMEAISQDLATYMFYGNSVDDVKQMLGLAPRFGSLSGETADQIVSAGGSGSDNTSVWFVSWGDDTCHTIYPQGTQAGIKRKRMDNEQIADAAGNQYPGIIDYYTVQQGLAVPDHRYIARVCNIDVTDVATYGAESDDSPALVNLMIDALNKLYDTNKGNTVIYCNRTIKAFMDKLAYAKSTPSVYYEDVGGRPVTKFMGFEVKKCDAILSTEDAVS